MSWTTHSEAAIREPAGGRADGRSRPLALHPAGARGRGGRRERRLLHGYLHKTSNCLCGIKGYASLIASAEDGAPDLQRWARRIIAEVDTMETVYRSIQEMAFPTLGEPGGRDLAGTVAAAVTLAVEDHPQLAVRCGSLAAGRLLLPAADLELILRELLANSAQTVPGGKDGGEGKDGEPGTAEKDGDRWRAVHVAIGLEPAPGHRVRLRCADDGPGMPAAILREAPAPFFTTREGRLGIGLSRVETIMDMYGLAWSLSSAPGRGTSVSLEVAAALRR